MRGEKARLSTVARIRYGRMAEWPIVLAWKAGVPRGTVGSNPTPSAKFGWLSREILGSGSGFENRRSAGMSSCGFESYAIRQQAPCDYKVIVLCHYKVIVS